MRVPEGHLEVAMTEKLPEYGKVNTRHDTPTSARVVEVMEPEICQF